ncbi:MAG TPA: hypothetical protein DCG75_10360 [Bacteroidales bacterium]|nr:hypothetical protein [Bacteroidales bacterium]
MLKDKVFNILIPKQGNSEQECEDCISIKATKEQNKKLRLRVAIADGATESSFAKEWSNLLTKSFDKFKLPLKETLLNKLTDLRKKQEVLLKDIELPWYAQEKAENGAFSAFLGIRIDLVNHNYEAIAIGDCCLFHIRNEVVIKQFPVMNSSEFGNNPYLISSKPNKNTDLVNYLIEEKGDLSKGDILFLMSDALAHWFMKNNELNEHPWNILLGLKGKTKEEKLKFNSWLTERRISKEIKNDDVVLAIIEL